MVKYMQRSKRKLLPSKVDDKEGEIKVLLERNVGVVILKNLKENVVIIKEYKAFKILKV